MSGSTRPPAPARPGSPDALDGGCLCSVLLNRVVGSDAGQDFVDPLCPLHGPATARSSTMSDP